uniref:Beta-arrestin-2 n=1 Tax=Ornithorhynchus anatinus TaxID=9258 RepID=F6UUG3_ORNAN
MSDRSLHLEASLDKELYYHGEPLSVNVHVTNNSTKTVKKIKVAVRQYADICLFSTAQYKCPVALVEQDDQIAPSSTFCKVYTLTPLLADNREKRGLALDGKLKHEDTNLASSTIMREGAIKEVLGIIVSYRVKVKLVVSRGGDVSVELPFVLMHPKPSDHFTLARPQSVPAKMTTLSSRTSHASASRVSKTRTTMTISARRGLGWVGWVGLAGPAGPPPPAPAPSPPPSPGPQRSPSPPTPKKALDKSLGIIFGCSHTPPLPQPHSFSAPASPSFPQPDHRQQVVCVCVCACVRVYVECVCYDREGETLFFNLRRGQGIGPHSSAPPLPFNPLPQASTPSSLSPTAPSAFQDPRKGRKRWRGKSGLQAHPSSPRAGPPSILGLGVGGWGEQRGVFCYTDLSNQEKIIKKKETQAWVCVPEGKLAGRRL